MFDFIRDSPAYQLMREDIRQELIPKFEQKMLEDLKQAKQKMLEEQKQAKQKMLEERKQMLATLRQTVVALVSERFPTLQPLAKAQVRLLKEPELFRSLILHLVQARDLDEAQNVLLALSEKDEDGEEREQA